jgi:hypothetical protein
MSISSNDSFLRSTLLGIAATALVTLSACGGGGGGGGGNSGSGNNATPTATTGTVAFLLTDAPTDAFCQVRATVQSIDLLGGPTPTNVFTGPETVDILDMRNFEDVFTVNTAVPVGTYDKIRLTLSDLALVECDSAGVPEPESGWDHPHLPGNGKLDLNPRGSFQVVGGEAMIIEIDMDMQKSLHIVQAGNSGKWQFRPVVFVTITPDDTKLVRVFGEVRALDGTTFELCPLEPASSTDNDAVGGGGDMSGDDNSGECLDVFTDGSTGIFDEAGSPVGPDAIANGDLLTAIGFLSLHDDNDDSDSRMNDLRLDAVVLELGPQGTFERIPGVVRSAPGNNDIFVFDPTPLDDATNAIDVLLQSGTRIFALGSNAELTSAALQPGTTGEVDGVFTDPATSGEPLKSSLAVLDQNTTPAVALIGGTIKTIVADDDAVPETRRVTVDFATPAVIDKCVKTDADTRYLQVTESASSSETAEITFADLAVGDEVDVYGDVDSVDSTCVVADAIQKYVTAP